jgi:hypothetical protein
MRGVRLLPLRRPRNSSPTVFCRKRFVLRDGNGNRWLTNIPQSTCDRLAGHGHDARMSRRCPVLGDGFRLAAGSNGGPCHPRFRKTPKARERCSSILR